MFWIMNPPPSPDMQVWGGSAEKVYAAFGLTKDQYWEEVKFTEKTLQVRQNKRYQQYHVMGVLELLRYESRNTGSLSQ